MSEKLKEDVNVTNRSGKDGEYKVPNRLSDMPIDTNLQQADFLDSYIKELFGSDHQDEGADLDEYTSWSSSQKREYGHGIIAELRDDLGKEENLGKTFYDLLRDKQQQVEQDQYNFDVTGPDGAWTEGDMVRERALHEQREILIYLIDTLKFAPEHYNFVEMQENFGESYCLNKRDIKINQLQNLINNRESVLAELASDSRFSDVEKVEIAKELDEKIEEAYCSIDDALQEIDILKEAMLRRSDGRTTSDILQSSATSSEKRLEYLKGLISSANSESAKRSFRRQYKTERNKYNRIKAIILDLDNPRRLG